MCSVPDLAALHHVNDVIVVAPDIFILIFQWTVINGDKRLPAAKLPEMSGIIYYFSVQVKQEIRLKSKITLTENI